MTTNESVQRGYLIAATFGTLLAAWPAAAQAPNQERVIGGPPNPQIADKIKGVPQPSLPAAADKLPLPMLKLPNGFTSAIVLLSPATRTSRASPANARTTCSRRCAATRTIHDAATMPRCPRSSIP